MAILKKYFLLLAIVFYSAAVASTSIIAVSPTYDEPIYLAAGFHLTHYHNLVFNPFHPPLIKCIAGLATYFFAPSMPIDTLNLTQDLYRQILSTMQRYADHFVSAILLGRLFVFIFNLSLLFWLYRRVRGLFDRQTGIIFLVLLCLSPTFFTHIQIVSCDVPVSLISLITLLELSAYLDNPKRSNLLRYGTSLIIGLLSKSTFLFALPFLILYSILFLGVFTSKAHRTLGIVRGISLTVLPIFIAFGTVATLYSLTLTSESQLYRKNYISYREYHGSDAVQLLSTVSKKVLGEGFQWYTVGMLSAIDSRNRIEPTPTIVAGDVYRGGRPFYFFWSILFKESEVWLAALFIGFLLVFKRSTLRTYTARQATILIVLLSYCQIYLGVATLSTLNIGLRLILPVYPPLCLCAAYGLKASIFKLQDKRTAFLAFVLIAFHFASYMRNPYFPDPLTYINGSTRRYVGETAVSDSNFDWGQDILKLTKYIAARPQLMRKKISVDVMTPLNLSTYDKRITAKRIIILDDAEINWTDLLAISRDKMLALRRLNPDRYAYLRDHYSETARFGGTIRLFRKVKK